MLRPRTTPRRLFLALVAILGLALAFAAACDDEEDGGEEPTATTAAEEVAPPGPGTFEVRAGDAEGVVTVLEFLPESVTVREGDTIRWTFPSPEIHTVTFLGGEEPSPVIVPIDTGPAVQINPAVFFPAGDPAAFDGSVPLNSGALPSEEPPADTFEATFTTAGTFGYVCVIHPLMTGTVTVAAAAEEVPSQSVIDAQGEEEFQTYVAEGQAAADTLEATSTDNPDGTKAWTMPMGITTEHTDILAFIPDSLAIGVGDTVTFMNDSEAPHTATFTSGADAPAFIQPQPQDAGPPILAINPDVAAGVPATEPPVEYNGSGYVNSGILGPAPEFQTNLWTAKFTAAGTFQYVCVLHIPNGMVGTVTVSE